MTDKQNKQQPYPPNYPPYEDEINLIDLLRVLWKWKWLIIGGTLISVIIAAVVTLQMPAVYEISTVIEPGIAGFKNDGGFLYIDSAANISGKVGGEIYNRRVEDALRLDTLKTRVGFKSTVLKKSDAVKITSQWQAGNTDLGVKVMQQMTDFLASDYAKIIERKVEYYDKLLTVEAHSMENTQNYIKMQQANLKTARQRRWKLLDELRGVNMEKIVQQRNALLKGKNQDRDISLLLLYSTTTQQNIASYFNQLSTQVYDLGVTEKKIEYEIDELRENMDDIKAHITALNLEKGLISNIQIIQEPELSRYPVKPKTKQIVLLTGVVALFILIFIAFFAEYIRKETILTIS